jgi:DNA primase
LVEKVRSSVDVVSLISEATPLKKSGRKYRGLCPFHNEKTPSFYVDETKQLFYCFGCGTGGDLFKFIMLRESVEFPEALRLLARRSGIHVPDKAGGPRRSEREALLGACRAAANLFRRILKERPEGSPGREYLKRRGVNPKTAEELSLGFAPDQWDTARDALQSAGHRPEVLQAAGILQRSDKGGRYYDRFRKRVIFPIVNLSGDVIGFGGRIVGEGEPKYLNSPETLLYNKRETLFGLYHSRHAIKEAGQAIVVEGYLDYAGLYQAGIRNVVATLGTSFTDEQASMLRRFTDKVVLNYDADPAGESATRRSLERLLSRGLSVNVLQLPGGQDPDSFLMESPADEYRKLLDGAPGCFDYLVESTAKGRDLADPAAVAAAAREILPILACVPSRIERSRYVGLLAERLKVEDNLLLAEMKDAMARDGRPRRQGPQASADSRPASPLREAEARLIRALVEDEASRKRLLPEILPADLEGSGIASIVDRIAGFDRKGQVVSYPLLSEDLPDRERQLLTRIAMRGDPLPDGGEAQECLQTLRRARLVKERNGIQKEMQETSDPGKLNELMRLKIDLSRRIDAMS